MDGFRALAFTEDDGVILQSRSGRNLAAEFPPEVRIALVCDNFSPHLTTRKCQRVGTWAAATPR
ncbi:hypothetical protein [Streptomyces flavidovirens]|uniref:hypothetical protein n=1 Tax=Streptomyces flavidovirens TaxID=67298 RepID=UPI003F540AFC